MPAESPFRDRNGPGFELIETFRWEPGAGFVRLDRHIARLAESARQLGFRFSAEAVDHKLRAFAAGNAPLRVRLTLASNGEVAVTTQPFVPLSTGDFWKLAIASTRLDAANPLIRHKTTLRTVYEAARAEYSQREADEVLLLNAKGRVCEGTITNIFIEDGSGRFLTPPLSCGLLPGILRAELIEEGRAIEAEMLAGDVLAADAVYLGNSLRGLIRAELAFR